MKLLQKQKHLYQNLSDCIKVLASDSVDNAHSGHPGMVLGMSDVMTVLVFDFLKFNPKDTKWFNRDRLVLSAGHGSLLLYTFYYLAGYQDFTLEDLKKFRKIHSKAPGHPEYGLYSAIETTTGPLGQGFGNAVGMAIAQKKYNQKLGHDICDYKIYCIVGDGCLMEGISYEVGALAGHLRLNNLIVLFDDNKISIDGKTSLAVSEDHIARFQSQGWKAESIDGHDFMQIHGALKRAQSSDKPYFIACNTIIAKGCLQKAGSEEAHGAPLGKEASIQLRHSLGFKSEEFVIPQDLKQQWEMSWLRNNDEYNQWQLKYSHLDNQSKSYLEFPEIHLSVLDSLKLETAPSATRVSSGYVIEKLAASCNKIICGSADLSLSNNVKNKASKVINRDDYSGNFIHYGVRENAMAAIMNGLAISGFLPIGGTFFVFSDYMKPAMRLSSIMHLQVIYIMTHDSIGLGEDGPTHQPVEQLAEHRANPNLLVFRPADFVETVECWKIALSSVSTPSLLALTRQVVKQVRSNFDLENLCAKGAYVLCSSGDNKEFDVTIFATGSELSIGKEVYENLFNIGISTRLVSVPCMELFFRQPPEYINALLFNSKLKVAIEAGSSFGWHRIIGYDGIFCGVDTFGLSAPYKDLYEHFNLTAEDITERIKDRIHAY